MPCCLYCFSCIQFYAVGFYSIILSCKIYMLIIFMHEYYMVMYTYLLFFFLCHPHKSINWNLHDISIRMFSARWVLRLCGIWVFPQNTRDFWNFLFSLIVNFLFFTIFANLIAASLKRFTVLFEDSSLFCLISFGG